MAERLYTIPITCRLDGQAHDVTDECVATGQQTGEYTALCGHIVVPAPMIAPVGRPCAECTAVLARQQPDPTTSPDRRPRHRKHGRLWRMLHPHRHAAAGAVTR